MDEEFKKDDIVRVINPARSLCGKIGIVRWSQKFDMETSFIGGSIEIIQVKCPEDENEWSYFADEIEKVDTSKSITCPKCSMTSYHPKDIEQRYCGNYHMYHENIEIR